jgi:hypothetical protein
MWGIYLVHIKSPRSVKNADSRFQLELGLPVVLMGAPDDITKATQTTPCPQPFIFPLSAHLLGILGYPIASSKRRESKGKNLLFYFY